MDPVLDRVRAANPASEAEFAGRADFAALRLEPRRRRRWLTVPAAGAVIAALVVLPGASPQASEVLARAVDAVAVDDGILYARSEVRWGPADGPPTDRQSREVWVQGETAMRWLEAGGAEEVYAAGEGTTRRSPDGETVREPGTRMVPAEIFRVRGLLERARGVELEEAGDAYVLSWREDGAQLTLWVDKDTYAPLRFTDRSPLNAYSEDIIAFEQLPDTPGNRKLLELGM